MAIRLLVAVTDRDWFEHLRARPALSEVNFWAPGAAPFRALQAGEYFLFKLHAPLNFIVGGGVFAYVTVAPDHRFNVSRRIKEEFENGRQYYQLHGQPIAPPILPNWSPDTTSLAWHNEQRYLG
jgi:hypothetical protein